MTLENIKEGLQSRKSEQRRKAAAEIGKQNLPLMGNDLFDAYLIEKKDSQTWRTKVQIILSLGIINYKPAFSEIEGIVLINEPYDMITYAAAQTYIRLKRTNPNDAKPIVEILKFGRLSAVDGALNPLAYDRMIPSNEEITELIKLSWNLHKHPDRLGKERGHTDPRYGLAAACAGWDQKLTTPFLHYCLETAENDPIARTAENALKGKYSKLR